MGREKLVIMVTVSDQPLFNIYFYILTVILFKVNLKFDEDLELNIQLLCQISGLQM